MFRDTLTIENPFGITVFGSALVRVPPDYAFISAAVGRAEEKPSDAVAKAQEGARVVAEFLRERHVGEFGTSRISLFRDSRINNPQQFHRAVVGFTIKVTQLDQLDSLITGVVEAGANEISMVQFQTSRLKEFRVKARGLAIAAAREKATNYAVAAGVSVGNVIHIQDVNPNHAQPFLAGAHFQSRGQEQSPTEFEETVSEKQTLDPGAIEVAAAVLVAFKLD
jgi:uncharacterized protein